MTPQTVREIVVPSEIAFAMKVAYDKVRRAIDIVEQPVIDAPPLLPPQEESHAWDVPTDMPVVGVDRGAGMEMFMEDGIGEARAVDSIGSGEGRAAESPPPAPSVSHG